MKTSANSLLADYALNDPQGFTLAIVDSSNKKIDKVLSQLPKNIAGNILVKLPPRTIIALLAESPTNFATWLDQADPDDTKAILLHLPKSRRRLLIKNLSNEMQRTAMRRFFSYPRHSVGRYASSEMITVSATMQTDDVVSLIKLQSPGMPVVILNEDNCYAGLLNPRKALEGSWDIPIENHMDEVDALVAEAALTDAAELSEWLNHSILAVVDHEDHVLGVISQRKITQALQTTPESEQSTDVITRVFSFYSKIFLSLANSLFHLRSRL